MVSVDGFHSNDHVSIEWFLCNHDISIQTGRIYHGYRETSLQNSLDGYIIIIVKPIYRDH